MLTEERQQEILKILDKKKTVSLKSLVHNLKASESTIRRDLSQLEKENRLIRIHGGAKKSFTLDTEQSIQEKTFKNSREKDRIAEYAASLVERQDTIYLDAGTTTYAMIPYLKGKEITVITNGIQSADALAGQNIKTILLGGQVKTTTKAVVGVLALKQLAKYRFSKVFLGINGIDLEYGLTTPDTEEAVLKQTAMAGGRSVYFLADTSKFDKVTFFQVAELDNRTVITNKAEKPISKEYKRISTIKEVEV